MLPPFQSLNSKSNCSPGTDYRLITGYDVIRPATSWFFSEQPSATGSHVFGALGMDVKHHPCKNLRRQLSWTKQFVSFMFHRRICRPKILKMC
ncbi:hypothetical protein PoB_005433500 [Plakobranchus ocellatus]|uniref:Uncharacterized protein n=1 Tax=Plakobranchus ocellatus TaxID=259542 RepID=A0AAV4C822_9GAST|nr:hypothetical protein PoB_005433500 [Plakobranchus ocellatus]